LKLEYRTEDAERFPVRYLRLLSNSIAAASLTTCFVLVLVLQLNPGLSLDPEDLFPIAATFGLFYIVLLTAVFFAILFLIQLFARERFLPEWISLGAVSWLSAGASAAGAVLMWLNLRTFSRVLEPEATDAVTLGAAALAGSAALFALVALLHRTIGSRRLWAACFATVAVGSVAGPMALRGRGQQPPLDARPVDASLNVAVQEVAPRVTIIAIDAGSLDLVTAAASEGRLANFGRILDAGAVMHLATLHPTSAEAVWAAVATGKLPQKNGVRSAGLYLPKGGGDPIRLLPDFCFAYGVLRFGLLTEQAHSSAALRVRTLWGILSASGITSGVVNWPLTYPAPVVRGYVVSDRYAQLALASARLDDPHLAYPPEVQQEAVPILQRALAYHRSSDASADNGATIPDRYQSAGRADRMNDHLVETLAAGHPTQITITRYQSLDPIGHYFLRYADPSSFGDVSEDERRRYGPVLENHYRLIDQAIGRALAGLRADDLLLVVSAYGMEPLGFGKRTLERLIGDPDLSGTHEAAPDGFLMAYGTSVARARPLRRASVVDVTPTVLYFLGLSVGRDMDGFVRTDLFRREFTADRPITFIPTYER
jgi:predicted AlkP superfamily phosphohydrolase/phosphomutase